MKKIAHFTPKEFDLEGESSLSFNIEHLVSIAVERYTHGADSQRYALKFVLINSAYVFPLPWSSETIQTDRQSGDGQKAYLLKIRAELVSKWWGDDSLIIKAVSDKFGL
jgi:hypothetical protein